MKDLSKKIRNGGVQKINSLKQLGGSRSSGKGLKTFNWQFGEQYKENFEKIFGKKKKNESNRKN